MDQYQKAALDYLKQFEDSTTDIDQENIIIAISEDDLAILEEIIKIALKNPQVRAYILSQRS